MTGMFKWFDRFVSALMVLGEIIVAVLCLHIVVQIIASAVFDSPLEGTDAIVSYWYMVPIVFLPLAHIQRNDKHIKAEIFTNKLGRKSRFLLDLVILAALGVFCALLTWQTMQEALQATRMNEAIELVHTSLPAWPGRWFVPLGFGAMGCAVVLMFIRRVVAGAKGREKP
ncbi:TRAP transporter small permease [Cognatishimia sp. D5M38]|jgi:TRAP-type C4-dicarboxylate transport system permease small subunit|uniref:TRAP transporter small permease protein n=1 Tax=Cognatishimia coralii TaxID=3083254 RepID=A0ABU8QK32_9RHOB|nr:TRAP transporter small permease [Sulfitobacter sp. PR48]MDD9722818.1 TRAP transporter small permease [Sulfitobacter sp. PR48]